MGEWAGGRRGKEERCVRGEAAWRRRRRRPPSDRARAAVEGKGDELGRREDLAGGGSKKEERRVRGRRLVEREGEGMKREEVRWRLTRGAHYHVDTTSAKPSAETRQWSKSDDFDS